MFKSIPLHTFLSSLNQNSKAENKWVKTLSYLEYIGYRKMVKSLGYSDLNTDIFHHLSDEIQHSFMLREIAEKHLSSHHENESKFLQAQEIEVAENYFQNLDSQVDDWIEDLTGQKNAALSYLWVSYIIELRAMDVYPQYIQLSQSSPIQSALKKIIADEEHHLSYLNQKIKHLPQKFSLEKFNYSEKESLLFKHFVEQFEALNRL